MNFDIDRFLTEYTKTVPLNVERRTAITTLLSAIQADADVTDHRWAAYMLATVKHECANKWTPITEFGPDDHYFNDKYGPESDRGKNLGNTQPDDGVRYKGRGYVQITGRANYKRLSAQLGLSGDDDLEAHPEAALRPAIAYRIMSHGMRQGSFTGKKLSDYINAATCDYRNARRIINALDQADAIKAYADVLEAALQKSLP